MLPKKTLLWNYVKSYFPISLIITTFLAIIDQVYRVILIFFLIYSIFLIMFTPFLVMDLMGGIDKKPMMTKIIMCLIAGTIGMVLFFVCVLAVHNCAFIKNIIGE